MKNLLPLHKITIFIQTEQEPKSWKLEKWSAKYNALDCYTS